MKYELADAMDEKFVPATSSGRANQLEHITASQAEQYIALLRAEVKRLRAEVAQPRSVNGGFRG